MKIYFCSPRILRDQTILDKKDKRNKPYVIHQIAHVVCKKDHPIFMEITLSEALNEGFSFVAYCSGCDYYN